MRYEHIAGACLCIAFTSPVAFAQQSGGTTGRAEAAPASSVVEARYPLGTFAPWRHVSTRSESGGRETIVETTESPGIEGRFEPLLQTVTETVRPGTDTAQTRRDVFAFDARQRTLVETVQTERVTSAAGTTSTIRNTSFPGPDGRPGFGSRQVEETRSLGPDTQHTETVTLMPGINEPVSERERTQHTERRVGPGVMRHETVHLRRDVNGGWQTMETRSGETREVGPAERVTEETVQRLDVNGTLAVAERTYTRRSEANGSERVDIETYSQNDEGFVSLQGRLVLSQRVHRMTRIADDGGREIVEEVEGRSAGNPSDPLRLIRRTVTTVRRTGVDRWARQTQAFELDANGRMVLVHGETEETAGP